MLIQRQCGLKTISQRIRGVSDDGEQMSGKLQAAFNSVGINIEIVDKKTGEMASTFDILKAIAERWDDLTEAQKQNIGELAAGKNQITNFNALLQNFDVALSATADAQNSAGSATKENERVLESVQGKIQQLKSAFESFALKTINSDFVKSIIDATTNLIKFVDKIGGAKTILILVSGIITSKFAPSIIQSITAISSFISNLAKGNISLTTFGGKLKESGKHSNTATISLNGYKLAIMAVTTAIAAYSAAQAAAQAAEEENKNTIQSSIDKKQEEIDTLEEQVKTYQELNEKKKVTSSTEELNDINKSLLNLQEKIRDTLGEQGKQIDLINGKYEEQSNILNNKLLQSLKDQEESLKASVEIAKNAYQQGVGSSSDLGTQKDKWYSMGRKLYGAGINWESDIKEAGIELNSSYTDLYTALKKGDIEQQTQLLEKWRDKLVEVSQSGKDVGEQLSWVQARLDNLKTSQDNYNNAADKLLQNQAEQKFIEMGGAVIKTKEDYDKFVESVKSAETPLEQFQDKTGTEHVSKLDEKILEIAETAFPEFSSSSENAGESAQSFSESLDSISDKIDSTQSAIETLDAAVYEYNNNGYMTIDTLQSLLQLGGDYTSMLEYRNGVLQLSAEGHAQLEQKMQDELLASISLAAYNELVALAEQKTGEEADKSSQYIDQIGVSLQNTTGIITDSLPKFREAAKELANLRGQSLEGLTDEDYNKVFTKYSSFATAATTIGKKSVSSIGTGKSKSYTSGKGSGSKNKKGSSSKSTKDTWKEEFESKYKALQHELNMEQITEEQYTNELESLYKKYFSNKTKYAEEYNKYEEEVYKKRKEIVKDAFQKELDELDHKQTMNMISERDYTNEVEKLYKKYFANRKEFLDEYTKYEEKVYESRASYLKADYDAAISIATNVIDKQISELEKQKSALEKVNDETDKAIELEKLRNDLYNAQNQKNIRTYYAGLGWVKICP